MASRKALLSLLLVGVSFLSSASVHAQDSVAVTTGQDTMIAQPPKVEIVLDTTQTLSEKLTSLFNQYLADSSNASLAYDIAQEYLVLGRPAWAAVYMKRALILDPTNMDWQFAQAELLLSLNKKKSAYDAYLKVLRDFKAEAYKDRIAERFASAYKITPLTFSKFDDIEPSFSPDGNKVLFQSNRNGNWDIYTMVIAQGEASIARLTTDASSEENPSYSPDGRFIVFTSTRDDKTAKRYLTREVYYMDANGKNHRKVTTSYGSDNWNPVFVDTQSVVFASDRLDFSNKPFWEKASGLYSIEKTGNFLFKIVGDDKSVFTDPYMIPQNNQILYVAKEGEHYDVFLAPADGKSKGTNLTNSTGDDIHPCMSKSGEFIVFASNRDGNFEIYRALADGSEASRVTNDDGDDIFPHFSPDGNRILFSSKRNGSFQIFMASLEETSSASVFDLIQVLEKKASTATDD